jgi:hypothetical protein
VIEGGSSEEEKKHTSPIPSAWIVRVQRTILAGRDNKKGMDSKCVVVIALHLGYYRQY